MPVSALMEYIFQSNAITVESREVRSSLALRVKILFSFSVVIGGSSIASINWIDGSSILVKLWDVENGTPKSSTLFKVIDVVVHVAQFSPDGQFLAVGRKSKNIIELWNVEDGKNT